MTKTEMMSSEMSMSSNDMFPKAIWISFGIHVGVVLIFTIKAIFFPSEPLILQNAIRVDLIALPDKVSLQERLEKMQSLKEKTAPEPVKEIPKPKEVPSEEKAITLSKIKKKATAALAKLKEMDALEKIRKQMEAERRAKKVAKLIKGNQISTGSDLKGLSRLEHENYVASVKTHVYKNWSLPEWLTDRDYQAQVLVKFDEDGNVIYKKIVKKSGNASFDDFVMHTIEASSPVPKPPDNLARLLRHEGILIGFPE